MNAQEEGKARILICSRYIRNTRNHIKFRVGPLFPPHSVSTPPAKHKPLVYYKLDSCDVVTLLVAHAHRKLSEVDGKEAQGHMFDDQRTREFPPSARVHELPICPGVTYLPTYEYLCFEKRKKKSTTRLLRLEYIPTAV